MTTPNAHWLPNAATARFADSASHNLPPQDRHLETLYPELRAGGFTRVDGTVSFYTRVNALLDLCSTSPIVLDFGAGRGAYADDPIAFRRDLQRFQHRAHVVGIDVDPAVLTNPSLDEAYVVAESGTLPIESESVDLILSDFTFEHIKYAAPLVAEFTRVLKPGGWVCARTPNKHGFIGIGARIVPNNLHILALRTLQPEKLPEDTFPTNYVMNTTRDIRRLFSTSYRVFVYSADSEPRYAGSSLMAARIFRGVQVITPPALRAMLHIFMEKRSQTVTTKGY